MKKVTDAEFKSVVLDNSRPVVVDVYADWCQPCKALIPVLDKIAVDYVGKADVLKVDGETEVNTVTTYNVASVPTLLFFKGGEVKKRFAGFQSDKTIRDTLNSLL